MPNTSVRAAAEGMPNTTRRTALAVTGSGLIAALGALAISTRPASPATVMSGDVADCVGAYYAAAAIAIDACVVASDASLAPDCPKSPRWSPATHMAKIDIGFSREMRSSDEAETFFAKRIETVQRGAAQQASEAWEATLGAALARGHVSTLNRLEALRNEALASLRAQEAAFAPIVALENEFDTAQSAAIEKFWAVVEVPCHSLADVRAKARALIHAADRVGCNLEHDEMRKVMFSLLGEQEA